MFMLRKHFSNSALSAVFVAVVLTFAVYIAHPKLGDLSIKEGVFLFIIGLVFAAAIFWLNLHLTCYMDAHFAARQKVSWLLISLTLITILFIRFWPWELVEDRDRVRWMVAAQKVTLEVNLPPNNPDAEVRVLGYLVDGEYRSYNALEKQGQWERVENDLITHDPQARLVFRGRVLDSVEFILQKNTNAGQVVIYTRHGDRPVNLKSAVPGKFTFTMPVSRLESRSMLYRLLFLSVLIILILPFSLLWVAVPLAGADGQTVDVLGLFYAAFRAITRRFNHPALLSRLYWLQNALLAVLFALTAYWFEGIVFKRPSWDIFSLSNTIFPLNTVVSDINTTLALLGLAVFGLLIITGRKGIQLTLAVLLLLIWGFQAGYWKGYREFLSQDMFLSAAGSPPAMWLDAFRIFFNPDSYLFVFILGFGLLVGTQLRVRLGRIAAAALLMMNIGLFALVFLIYQQGVSNNMGTSINRFAGTAVEYIKTVTRVPTERMQLPVLEGISKPDRNIVLVIDESVRADHLSINGYLRETTPRLDQLARERPDLVHNWGGAASGSSNSRSSNPMILTGFNPAQDGWQKFATTTASLPTLFQYARQMGYTTHFYDVQTDLLWNGLTKIDLKYIDHWVTQKNFPGPRYRQDFQALEKIFEIVQQTSGNFIVINKMGAHFSYRENYPPHQDYWQPVPRDDVNDRHLIANEYDNALRYNSDSLALFYDHIDRLTHNTYLLYTADHGETLFEDGATWVHSGPTRKENTVPLILIGKLDQPVDTTYAANHSNILPTLLDLMKVPDAMRVGDYNLSLLRATAADNRTRYFITPTGQRINYDELPR